MRHLLLSLLALALLAAGCAGNRTERPDIAPSRQAALGDPNSGWSVPPGQKSVTDPQPAPAAPTRTQAADEAALAEADRKAREASARDLRERLQRPPPQQAAEATEPTRRAEPRVKPLVPAFPARARQERISTLRTVHFAFDSWELSAETRTVLQANAAWMKANPDVVIRVEGHADERGTAEYNLALGERRAKGVREFLIEQGVPADNLRTASYGEEVPLDRNHNSKAWSLNRRAEFSRAEATQVSDNRGQPTSG